MSTALQPELAPRAVGISGSDQQGFVTMRVGGQLIGVSVLVVQDVLRHLNIARVPLSPTEVAGVINLRGRIVTVIDMHYRLGLGVTPSDYVGMHCVVEFQEELYSLMVDSVGEVLNIPIGRIDRSPSNLERHWKDVCAGVYKLDGELLVLLDVQALLTF